MKPPDHVHTLLLGATFYAAAYAASDPENCLILDGKSVVGSDFADCMHAAPCRIAGLSPRVDAVRTELRERGLLDAGGLVHIVPCSCILAGFLVRHAIPILLETQVVSIDPMARTPHAGAVRIFNRDGFQTLTADRIVDTNGWLTGRAFRSLGVMLVNGSGEPPVTREDPYWIQKGLFPDEYILHLAVAPEDTLVSARLKLFRLIASGATARCGWQAAAAASTFAYHYPDGPVCQETGDGVRHIPSASYGNLLAAMEGGARDAISHAA